MSLLILSILFIQTWVSPADTSQRLPRALYRVVCVGVPQASEPHRAVSSAAVCSSRLLLWHQSHPFLGGPQAHFPVHLAGNWQMWYLHVTFLLKYCSSNSTGIPVIKYRENLCNQWIRVISGTRNMETILFSNQCNVVIANSVFIATAINPMNCHEL